MDDCPSSSVLLPDMMMTSVSGRLLDAFQKLLAISTGYCEIGEDNVVVFKLKKRQCLFCAIRTVTLMSFCEEGAQGFSYVDVIIDH